MASEEKSIIATELTVNMPFKLGHIKFKENDIQQIAAWKLYVELSTRISSIPINEDEGVLREALSSLYQLFEITRQILKTAGPTIAIGENSFGAMAIQVLNKGIRPFLVKWHPILRAYEEKKPEDKTTVQHELEWTKGNELRKELEKVRHEMLIYVDALSEIAGIKLPS